MMLVEAETGEMQPQAEEHLEPPGPGIGMKRSLLEPSEEWDLAES